VRVDEVDRPARQHLLRDLGAPKRGGKLATEADANDVIGAGGKASSKACLNCPALGAAVCGNGQPGTSNSRQNSSGVSSSGDM